MPVESAHGTVPVRLGVQNLFLIRPVRLGGGRGIEVFDPGAHPERVAEYEAMLPDHYDIWAATELFAPADVDRLTEAWRQAPRPPAAVIQGPAAGLRHGNLTNSGLAVFVSGWSVVGIRRHRFESSGRRRVDADPWAAKGVLWIALSHPLGAQLDVAATHLHAGGYGGPEPPDAPAVRRDQVEELVDAVSGWRRDGVPLVIGGDWNIAGGAAGSAGGGDDEHLRQWLARLDLVDAWDVAGDGEGYTADCKTFPDHFTVGPDGHYCLEPAAVAPELSRIDRCFVSADGGVDVTSIRRRPHRRADHASGRDIISTLSDHVGLDLDLEVALTSPPPRRERSQ